MKLWQAVSIVSSGILIVLFQNCASQYNYDFSVVPTVAQRFGQIQCVSFSVEGGEICTDAENGLIGKLYYLLDKTDGSVSPAELYDKDDVALSFNGSVINSVNVVIERGFQGSAYIHMPDISVPAIPFSSGFTLDSGASLTDMDGKLLIEGFALDLHGKLKLAPNLPEGRYEIGLLSDDGSLLDMDLNGDGVMESVIQNDGYHSPRLQCSTIAVSLNASSAIPMRLRYYQGPRTTIALTLVMRQLEDGEQAGQDEGCGYGDSVNGRWYGEVSTAPNYKPDFVNSRFGDLLSRGWFIPTRQMFGLPDSLAQ